jgi:hypothetical protein
MGTQQQTPRPGTEKPSRSGEQKPRKSGQDAADVPRSDDDLGMEDEGGEGAREGTREDAAGSESDSSRGS